MLGRQSEFLLKQILDMVCESEVIIETQRQNLCRDPAFSPYSAFCRIDRLAHERVCSHDIARFLKENGCTGVSPSDAAFMLRFFDSDQDGSMCYEDFLQVVLPCDDSYLRADVLKRPYSRVGRFDQLPYTLESAFTQLLNTEVDFHRRVQILIRDLARQPDYTPAAAYRTIDTFNEGNINCHNLSDFFRSHGLYLVEKEIMAIIRRCDLDGDARISFPEFTQFFKSNLADVYAHGGVDQTGQRSGGLGGSSSKSDAELTWKQKQQLKHRSKVMETPSMLDANIQRDIERIRALKMAQR